MNGDQACGTRESRESWTLANRELGNYLMRSLFMYILQSDNYFALLRTVFALLVYLCFELLLLFGACALLHLILTCLCLTSLPHVSPLDLVTTLLIPPTFSDNHTTGHSIPVSKFTGLAGFLTTEYLTPRRSSDHLRQESDPPHHARTDESNYSSMESFL